MWTSAFTPTTCDTTDRSRLNGRFYCGLRRRPLGGACRPRSSLCRWLMNLIPLASFTGRPCARRSVGILSMRLNQVAPPPSVLQPEPSERSKDESEHRAVWAGAGATFFVGGLGGVIGLLVAGQEGWSKTRSSCAAMACSTASNKVTG